MAFAIDNVVLFLAAVLVIFMQPGFAMVEAGFNAGKNTVNILFKNVMDLNPDAKEEDIINQVAHQTNVARSVIATEIRRVRKLGEFAEKTTKKTATKRKKKAA